MYHLYTHCITATVSMITGKAVWLLITQLSRMYHTYTHCIYYISIYDYREGSLIVNYTIEVDVLHIHTLYLLHKYI